MIPLRIRPIAGSGYRVTYGVSIPRSVLDGWEDEEVSIKESGDALVIYRSD